MAINNGNKLAKKLYVGSRPVRAVYAGSQKVWPSVVRVARGVNYGAWTYADPVRRRTATPWEQDIYCDDSVGDVRYGTTSTQEETATTAVDWDGSTYWNGSCGSNYYYVDYKKVRTRYTYDDVTRYSGYYNGDSRSRRIEGSCGWVRDWRVISDWANNGYTCNAAGTRDAYDCSGTYCVRYNQQQRTLSYCFPDLSGSTQTKVEYRAGSESSRTQEDGKCGYTNTPAYFIPQIKIYDRLDPRNDHYELGEDITRVFEIKKVDNDNWSIVYKRITGRPYITHGYLSIVFTPLYLKKPGSEPELEEGYLITLFDEEVHNINGPYYGINDSVCIDKDDQQGQSTFKGQIDIDDESGNAHLTIKVDIYGF